MSSPSPNNDNIDNPSPDTPFMDADKSLSLLRDTSTNERGGDDYNNKNTGGDDVDADQTNVDSAEIELMIDPIARKLLED
jgi:hypothetical protein